MRKLMTILFAASAVAAGPAAMLSASGSASADTTACASASTTHNGVTANWCASQENVTHHLMIAAPNKVSAYAQATVKPSSSTNASEDFQWFPPSIGAAPIKVAEYSPHGVGSGLCLAVNNKHTKVVFKHCNSASLGQQWIPGSTGSDGGNTWTSMAGGLAITIPGGSAFSRLVLGNDAGATNQTFTYVQ